MSVQTDFNPMFNRMMRNKRRKEQGIPMRKGQKPPKISVALKRKNKETKV